MPVQIECGNILEHEADVLVLPCNGSGIMGFVSLAGEVRRRAGRGVYTAFRKLCPMDVGDVHLISGNDRLRQDNILFACTMIFPGTPIPVEHVTMTAQAIMDTCYRHGMDTIVWPLLGAGGGRMRAEDSFREMMSQIEHYRVAKAYDPHIRIVERDPHKFRAMETLYSALQA